jgi:hypothetical protein
MSVRAMRMTVLESAGNFTRYECDDLSAEKIPRVKCFVFTRCGIRRAGNFRNAGAAGRVRNFPAMTSWWKGQHLPIQWIGNCSGDSVDSCDGFRWRSPHP